MDAIRISDGTRVVIKNMSTTQHPAEIPIHRHLTSSPLDSEPQNHCTPLYEVIQDPRLSTRSFMVMPLLLPCDQVPFDTVGEVLDFIRQIFEVSMQTASPAA
jgi:hypothetical protein